MFFSGNKRRIEIGSGAEWQTEGVCYISTNRIFVSCETTDSIPASIFTGTTLFVPTAVNNVVKTNDWCVYPSPANETLHVSNMKLAGTYEVTNLPGQSLLHGNLNAGDNTIDIKVLTPGTYLLNVRSPDGTAAFARFTRQ